MVNVAIFWPIMARTSYGINLRTAAITSWSGIRGIVGLILALSVLNDDSIQNAPYQVELFFFMATTLVLTTVIQGSSYVLLLKVSFGMPSPTLSRHLVVALFLLIMHVRNIAWGQTRPCKLFKS